MKIRHKHQYLLSVGLVAFLVGLGITTGMVIAPAEAQSTYATIGYVDIEQAVAAHPQLESVLQQILDFENERVAELTTFDDLDTVTEEQRNAWMEDLYRVQDEVDQKRQELTAPLIQDVIDATTAVGMESGIEVILESGAVIWGGLDLTLLIVQRIQSL